MRWNGDYSEGGRYMIQRARPLHTGVEHRLLFSREGGPPYRGIGIYDTRREAKAAAQEHAQRQENTRA
jgi:hypothetical protein